MANSVSTARNRRGSICIALAKSPIGAIVSDGGEHSRSHRVGIGRPRWRAKGTNRVEKVLVISHLALVRFMTRQTVGVCSCEDLPW